MISTMNDFDNLVLKELMISDNIQAMTIADSLGCPKIKVIRSLGKMLAADIVDKHGTGRSTSYSLSQQFMKNRVSIHGIGIPYNFSFLNDYNPNVSGILDEKSLKSIHEVCGKQKVLLQGDLLRHFIADLTYESARLEGSTYSRLDTSDLINKKLVKPGGTEIERLLVLNHADAIQYTLEATKHADALSVKTIKDVHSLLSNGLLPSQDRCGSIRNRVVYIHGSDYQPLDNAYQLDEELHLLVDKASLINDPFEQSIFLMVSLSYLQAFDDMNKRTARVICNIPFLLKNMAPITFSHVDESIYHRALLKFYETNNTKDICNLFSGMCIRSNFEYVVAARVQKEVHENDIQWRTPISMMVRYIVEHKLCDNLDTITQLAANLKLPKDAKFYTAVQDALNQLTEENLVIYRLSKESFLAYKDIGADDTHNFNIK